jgi:farnesyl-diphosphate farnesyltransferase
MDKKRDKTDQLLEETSRTFALCIPLLPDPTRQEVSIAYLLFRIADTFEDSAIWSSERRIEALQTFEALMDEPTPGNAEQCARMWTEDSPTDHDGYQNLLEETPTVLQEFTSLDDEAQRIIRKHVKRTAQKMGSYVRRTDTNGTLRLRTMEELQVYCYAVAGIVGEMLTDLFIQNCSSLERVEGYLRERAPYFGEGLQLTNILKDTNVDVEEGRSYLDGQLERDEVFDRARSDLDAAAEYTLALQKAGAPRGTVAFNALPLRLAWGTLDRVEEEGPGAKLTRPEVFGILDDLHTALDREDPAVDHPAADRPLEAFQEDGTSLMNGAPSGPARVVESDEANVA